MFFLLLSLYHIGHSQDSEIPFKLNGKSLLVIKNETKDTINIQIENWYLIPGKAQKVNLNIKPKSLINVDLIVQGYTYYDLVINGLKQKLFTRPFSIDTVSFTRDNNSIMPYYYGNLGSINEFLLIRTNTFGSADSDWLPRVNATHNEDSFEVIEQINDSVTSLHQEFLNSEKTNLPQWYITFESERLNYLNAGSKLNSLFYREKMLKKDDRVAEGFLNNTVSGLRINNENMVGNARYTFFLMDYIGYLLRNDTEGEAQDVVNRRRYEIIDEQLSGIVRDVYISVKLSIEIERNRHLFDPSLTSKIKKEDLKSFLNEQYNSNPILPKGATMPYFYLMDSSEVFYKSTDFADKVVLINFWATWCKPCIEDFPDENRLVEKYKGAPVEIINICLESDLEKWKEFISKYNLKTMNLISQGAWDDKLSESFNINGLPHSVLIDNGKIVQNKCPSARKGVEKQIDQILKIR